jgi:hypothetical protein
VLFCSIHAAQPTPRHLRSVCTEVALVVSDLLRYEDQKPERALRCLDLIVPTLRVVTQRLTLCVNGDAERPGRHSHAERGNDQKPVGARLPAICREPAANPVCAVDLTLPRCLALLLLRSRSRARWSATPGRSYALRAESKSGQPRGSLFARPWLLMLEQSS